MVAALEMGGEPGGQQDLANQLAYLLPFDTERKLELLALPDADATGADPGAAGAPAGRVGYRLSANPHSGR